MLVMAAGIAQVAPSALASEGPTDPMLLTKGPITVGSSLEWSEATPSPGRHIPPGSATVYVCLSSVTSFPELEPIEMGIPGCGVRQLNQPYIVQKRDEGQNIFYSEIGLIYNVPGPAQLYTSAPVYVPIENPNNPAPTNPNPNPMTPTSPGPNTLTLGNQTLTPSQLALSATQNPSIVIDCSSTCTAVLASKLQLGSVPLPWTGGTSLTSSANHVKTINLKSQKVPPFSGNKTVTIKLSGKQHREIRKALASHMQARVITVAKVPGQAQKGQLDFVFHR